MSCTTTSGRVAAIAGRVSPVARTIASYGDSGCSMVGNTGYSGAATNAIPPPPPGRVAAIAGRVSPVARTIASYGDSGCSMVGNTGYSGAATNAIPPSR